VAKEAEARAKEAEARTASLTASLRESQEKASAAAAALGRVQSELSERAQTEALQTSQAAKTQGELTQAQEHIAALEAELAQVAELTEGKRRAEELAGKALLRVQDLESFVETQSGENERLQTTLDGIEVRHAKDIRDLKGDIERAQGMHDAALEEQRLEAAKKSAAARKMVAERDGKIKELEARAAELAETLQEGSPEDRHMTAIARAQASRDAAAQLEAENRDIALQRLQAVVEQKDLELATRMNELALLRRDLQETRQRSMRETSGGVNAEYLKNVLVEYLSFPAGSSERKVLFPVLATLLQFDKNDMRRITHGAGAVQARPVKDISSNRPRALA